MALNIFRDNEAVGEKSAKQFEGVVGSFRAGFLDGKEPKSLDEWRVTTGDPEVADAIHALLGGEAPAEWETKGEEALEVYTSAKSVSIVLEGPNAVRQRFIQRNKAGEVVFTSDGAMRSDGERDAHASLGLEERLKLATDGMGPDLETTVWFKLADSYGEITLGGSRALPGDLGKFRYNSTGKSIGRQVDRDQIEAQIEELCSDYEHEFPGRPVPIKATLKIEKVSFTAKTGARAGKLVEFNTAVLKIHGIAR